MGEESVSVQVEYLNRSEEFKKDCAKGIENQSKVNRNAMILDGSSPKASNLTELSRSREVGASSQSQEAAKSSEKGTGKPVKRKRDSSDGNVLSTDKETLVAECHRELNSLFEYYKELSAQKLNLEEGMCTSNNSLVAGLLEESNLAYSKLVEVIYEKLKGKEGITMAIVRSGVLSVGQRISYGISNAEADLLEDESETCLWCWETKDMKLLPTNQRGDLNVQRAARKKIHERISALSATLSALAIPENQNNYKSDLRKASMKLGKIPNVEEIRSLVEKKKQKHDTGMAEKVAKLKEKESIREIQKEKLQTEKEIKRIQDEAEKEAKRQEKDGESKKQLKKQQDEAERERRRRGRAEAELKEQRSVKKQATIMERFLTTKKSNDNSHSMEKLSSVKAPIRDSPPKVEVVNTTASLMDNVFSRQDGLALADLRKLHVDGWHELSRCNRSCHWGVRNKPKVELFKELKLHESSTEVNPFEKAETLVKEVASSKDFSRDLSVNKLVDDGSEKSLENHRTDTASNSIRLLRKKLLQFDKSNRPAYYGTWIKKSCTVGPRHPLRKDPDLDYDVDSDEEWEEEEPGESLSDCEKDADEERLEEENLKFEEEESEDDFFVPDGYLSENEGVQVDDKSDRTDDQTGSSSSGQSEVESEGIKLLLQQQKYLQTLTEQALRKAHPLVISNLMHEKSEIKMVGDINSACKIEQMCLQALSMQFWTGSCIVDLSVRHGPENEDKELLHCQNKNATTSQSQNKSTITPSPSAAAISDSDLPDFVSSIQSNSHGINKVLESLQGKFPTTPKSHLRNKVKEMSNYVDNRWQVKKEILDRLGLSTTPGKDSKPKGIATFFSKRCLPPERESISVSGTSPQQCSKTEVLPGDSTQCSSA